MRPNSFLMLTVISFCMVSNLMAREQVNGKIPGIAAKPTGYFYTGKPYDADLNAYTFKYRNYDPTMTRWTSADPSGFPDGVNNRIYAPVPTFGLDKLGLDTTYVRNEIYYQYFGFEGGTPFSMTNYYKAVLSFVPGFGTGIGINDYREQMMTITGDSVPDDFFDSDAFQDAINNPRQGWGLSHDDWEYLQWGVVDGPDGPAPDMNKVISENTKKGATITYIDQKEGEPMYMVVKTYFTHTVVTE